MFPSEFEVEVEALENAIHIHGEKATSAQEREHRQLPKMKKKI